MTLPEDDLGNEKSKEPVNSEILMEEEKEPLNKEICQEKRESEESDKSLYRSRDSNFVQRFRRDSLFRRKFLNTVFLWWSFASLGWAAAQFGPTFLDLQILTHTNLDKASAFMTVGAIGYLAGSLIVGFLFRRINTYILLVVVCFAFSAATVVIPWCTVFEVMIVVLLIRGIAGGMQDTAGNSQLLRTWGSENKSYMQALHFFFAFGGIISPIATAPFLAPVNDFTSTNSTSEITNVTTISYIEHLSIGSNSNQEPGLFQFNSVELVTEIDYTSTTENILNISEASLADNNTTAPTTIVGNSQFYIAYLITAVLYFTAGGLFVISFCITSRSKHADAIMEEKNEKQERKLSLFVKVLVLINVSCLMILYCAIEESFSSFLTTFLVKQLSWSKSSGAYATSIFWASFCAGRFIGIFLIKCLKPFTMILCCFILLHIVYIGMIVSSLFHFDAGIWICATVAGLAMSVTFPTIFSWTDENLVPVSGAVVSLLMISASVGGMVNPLILGYFMDHVTPLYFCYIPLGECVVFISLFFVAFCCSRSLKKVRFHTSNELAVEVGSN